MLTRKITTSGNSAALVLSQDLLGLMGIAIGDEVWVELVNRTLVVRPLRDAKRTEVVAGAVDDVIARRQKLLTKLANDLPSQVGGGRVPSAAH